MKKLFYMLAVAGVMTLAGCSKEHQCKCVTTDVQDDGLLKVLVVDNNIKCEDISVMGFEIKTTNEEGQTLERTEMHTVSCREYDE